MSERKRPRRSLWMFGLESEEPSYEQRVETAAAGCPGARAWSWWRRASRRPSASSCGAPRISPPERLSGFCRQDNGSARTTPTAHDRTAPRSVGHYPNPPDVVAHPRNEAELEAVLEWCADGGYCAIPYGGGSSVVWRRDPAGRRGTARDRSPWTSSTGCWRSTTSRGRRASRPACSARQLEDQLRPHGYTLRHFPQSFTVLDPRRLDRDPLGRPLRHQPHPHRRLRRDRSRMLTPQGWWESRRLPGLRRRARPRTAW